MTGARFASLGICSLFVASLLSAADFSTYRGMTFGMRITAAAKIAGGQPADARMIHQRPALIQELDWQPRPSGPANSFLKTDSVREGTLSFYNGELSRIVITYDRYQIEGLTPQDMIDGISAVYGTASTPAATVTYHSIYGETTPVLARWEDADYSWNLIRTGDKSSFSLIFFSKRLDALAQTDSVEAARLDVLEAPQRELARQKQRDSDEQVVLDKARSVNKPAFRP